MRVLVDTSVWIDHLHRSDPNLVALLESTHVVMHPAVLGELACGMMRNRQELLSLWLALPCVVEVSSAEALALLENRRLWGRGLGWIDVHLLGSALVSEARLWTRDHLLRHAARQLRISLVT